MVDEAFNNMFVLLKTDKSAFVTFKSVATEIQCVRRHKAHLILQTLQTLCLLNEIMMNLIRDAKKPGFGFFEIKRPVTEGLKFWI